MREQGGWVLDTDWLAESSDVGEAAALTGDLVSIRSYPGDEHAVQQAVAEWFTRQGMTAEMQPLPDGRQNVIVTVENGDGPVLLLNGHVDTVLAAHGWDSDPWEPRIDGDRMYGLGACDMKSGVAAAMLATRALARRRDLWQGTVIFTSVVDEEAYSVGARGLVERGVRADACIVTEAGFDNPAIGAVGKVLVRVDVHGKAAHGSWPADGINAAVEAARFVTALEDARLGVHPHMTATQCVLSFHSGSDQYVITVPERAQVLINRHIVPGETGEGVLADMRVLADSLNSAATFVLAIDPPYYPPWEIDSGHPLLETFTRAFEAETGRAPELQYNWGVADTNYFAADLGIPSIQFGPHGGDFHQANEWVDLPSIGATIRIVLRTALEVFEGKASRTG
jgi:acetylornithine deacetylase/succinyl-diaminopimelate desuccinylase-like protein